MTPTSEWADLFIGYTEVVPLVASGGSTGLAAASWAPAPGGPLRVLSRKLDARELHDRGRTGTVVRYQMLVDTDASGEAPLTEKQRLRHPELPDLEDGLDVVSVVPYPTEGMAVVEAEATL